MCLVIFKFKIIYKGYILLIPITLTLLHNCVYVKIRPFKVHLIFKYILSKIINKQTNCVLRFLYIFCPRHRNKIRNCDFLSYLYQTQAKDNQPLGTDPCVYMFIECEYM